MTQSCKDCPSHQTSDQMLSRFNATLGCSFCPTTGTVLTTPPAVTDSTDQIETLVTIGTRCQSFGSQVADPQAWTHTAEIAVGDPQAAIVMASKGNTIAPIDKPFSCTSCVWFATAEVVKRDLGYDAPMCIAKGRLLFPRNLLSEAANCGTGLNGANASSTKGIYLKAEYLHTAPIVIPPPEPVNLVVQASKHAVDPRSYPTDREVTPEDEANFIRAWREVADPEGLHESVFMPIFDGLKLYGFDPRTNSDYGQHRPDLFIDHAGLLYDLWCELRAGEHPVLIGSAGAGKSEVGCWIAWLMDLTFDRIDVNNSTEADSFIGRDHLVTVPGKDHPVTEFKFGKFALGYGKPGITMINEPNLVQDVYEFLRPVFDNAQTLSINEAQGISIERHSNRYILCSQNPSWDVLNTGTEQMAAAEIDRITPVFVDLPSEAVERQIIKAHCNDAGYDITDRMLDKIMQVAIDLRDQIANGTLPIAWGLRAQIKVAKKTQRYSFEKAYRRAVIDGMEPSVVDQIMISIKSVA